MFFVIFIIFLNSKLLTATSIFNVAITLNDDINVDVQGTSTRLFTLDDINYFDLTSLRRCLGNDTFDIDNVYFRHEYFKKHQKKVIYSLLKFKYYSSLQKEDNLDKYILIYNNTSENQKRLLNDSFGYTNQGYTHKTLNKYSFDAIFQTKIYTGLYSYIFNFTWDPETDSSFYHKTKQQYDFTVDKKSSVAIQHILNQKFIDIELIFNYELFGDVLIELKKHYNNKYYYFLKIKDALAYCNLKNNDDFKKHLSISNVKLDKFIKHNCSDTYMKNIC